MRELSSQEMVLLESSWLRLRCTGGDRYASCTFDNYVVPPIDPSLDRLVEQERFEDQSDFVAKARDYASNIDRAREECINLFFCGHRGTGKDHMVYAVAMEAFRHKYSVEWVNGPEMLDMLRGQFSSDSDEAEIIAPLLKPDFLWISDPIPQIGPMKSYSMAFLYRLIDARYKKKKPVWVTLNVMDREEADAKLGCATMDRIRHNAVMHLCNWSSYRVMFEGSLSNGSRK